MNGRTEARHVTAVDGVRLAYREQGSPDAPAVVLLHSLGADGHMWDACAQILAESCRVIIPETRGHGSSAAAASTSVDRWVDDLESVLAAADVQETVLVGVSMGGIQAMAYAAAHPEQVGALVVADSFAVLPQEVAERKVAAMTEMARSCPMAEVASQYVADTFRAPYSPGAESVRRAITGMEPDSYVAAVDICFRVQITDRLERVAAPTRVLWGDRDTKTPLPLSEQIADLVPDCTLGVVSGAGHLSNVDEPEQFAAEVLKHTRQAGSRPALARSEGEQNDG